MSNSVFTAIAIVLVASVAVAGDAGEEVIRLGPPQDNDVFAGASAWKAPAAATGRHGNPAAIAAEMAARDIERETAIFAAR